GFDGGDDAQLYVIAGEGEVETFGFQQNALQGGGGGAGRYGAGDAVDGGAQKSFVADDVQFRFSPFLLAWTCGVPVRFCAEKGRWSRLSIDTCCSKRSRGRGLCGKP